jgi:hypothetical protein
VTHHGNFVLLDEMKQTICESLAREIFNIKLLIK